MTAAAAAAACVVVFVSSFPFSLGCASNSRKETASSLAIPVNKLLVYVFLKTNQDLQPTRTNQRRGCPPVVSSRLHSGNTNWSQGDHSQELKLFTCKAEEHLHTDVSPLMDTKLSASWSFNSHWIWKHGAHFFIDNPTSICLSKPRCYGFTLHSIPAPLFLTFLTTLTFKNPPRAFGCKSTWNWTFHGCVWKQTQPAYQHHKAAIKPPVQMCALTL